MSRVISHQASSDGARHVSGTSSTVSTRRPDSSRSETSRAVGREPERARRIGVGPLHEPQLERAAAGGRHPLVPVWLRPHRHGRPAAGPEHSGDLGGRTLHVGDQHQPPAAQHAVHRLVVERQRRGVLDGERHVFEPELGGAPPRRFEHLRRDVGRQQMPAGEDSRQRQKPGVARSGRELEDRLTRPRIEELHEPLRDHVGRRPDQLTLPLPTSGDRPPRLDLLLRVYAAAPANWGITSRPYASSVSSWPCVIR